MFLDLAIIVSLAATLTWLGWLAVPAGAAAPDVCPDGGELDGRVPSPV